ncbi:MAG: hypothetical protein FJX72_13435, partial [Armatimonadetes bacterium]|nr:hypothetical protein [Armatimonadota bacterium]
MKQRHLPIAATLTIASLVAICGAARAQEDPYRALRSYDFQERASLAAIQQEIVAARGVASKLDPIEAKLIAVLTDAGAKFGGKQEACKFLGSIGTARSVPALSRMLSGDARQADAARYALERIAAPEAAKALRSALASAKGGVLAGIVNSLGARKDAAAVAPLRKLAASADPAVRSAAVEALGHIGTQPALAALQRLPKPDARAYDAMLRCADALAGAGKGAMAEPVYVGLTAKGKPAFVRVTAMRGLAAMKSAKAGAAALGAINDPDVYVQRGAGRVVAQSADPGVTRKAAAALASAPPDAQIVLLTGWADRREPLAAAAALKLTASDVPDVRAAAIRASGRTGGVGSVKALAGIAARGGDDAGIAREALAEMPGKPAAEAILRLSRDGKPEVRAAMMAVIGERPGASSMAALIAGARDPGAPIAVAALRALAGVGGAAEVAPLAAVLVGTASDEIREAAGGAVTACVQRSGQRDLAVTPVLQAIAGAATQPRCALLGVLAEIGGDKALGELTRATASDDPDVKRAAVKGLADTS